MTRLVLSELFVTNLPLFEHQQQQKLLVSWQFSGPYGVTKYGSGWRKDVVNQCLELGRDAVFSCLSFLLLFPLFSSSSSSSSSLFPSPLFSLCFCLFVCLSLSSLLSVSLCDSPYLFLHPPPPAPATKKEEGDGVGVFGRDLGLAFFITEMKDMPLWEEIV